MNYPVAETFYSIIGEGEFTGQAAFFIRLAGCNLACNFCDTDYRERYTSLPEELLEEALKYPSRKVVITGGEPTIHPLKPLTDIFRKEFKIHLETNGTIRPDSMDFDWIAVSPKDKGLTDLSLIRYASEVKFLCGTPDWKETMEYYLPMVYGHKWLMPIADGLTLNQDNIKMGVDYCLRHPKVKFCCQIHKIIGVK